MSLGSSSSSNSASSGKFPVITRSKLIAKIADKQPDISFSDIDQAVKVLINCMTQSIIQRQRVEIRGFGAFFLHLRPSYQGRNPRTGKTINLPPKYVLRFRPAKELRGRINNCPPEGESNSGS